MHDVIVIGAGQAGLAAGYHLQRKNLDFTILEAGDQPAGSWPHYYDSLTLFSPAGYSSLPGMKFPGDPHRYPARDEVVDYLTAYARAYQFPVRTHTYVQRVEQTPGGFRVITTGGEFFGRALINASGSFNRPYLPVLPGSDIYKGQIRHSRGYRNRGVFKGRRVIVVGAGNSAIQIAVELARSARVTLATREPVRYMPQRILNQDLHFWLKVTGVDWLMPSSTKPGSVAVLDTGAYRRAIETGRPGRKPMFTRFTETGVIWPDGAEEPVDAVLFATGYRPNLEFLSGIPALDSHGRALQHRGISATVPGLYYVGFSNQRGLASATLRGVGPDADIVTRHLAGYLRGDAACTPSFLPFSCCADVAHA